MSIIRHSTSSSAPDLHWAHVVFIYKIRVWNLTCPSPPGANPVSLISFLNPLNPFRELPGESIRIVRERCQGSRAAGDDVTLRTRSWIFVGALSRLPSKSVVRRSPVVKSVNNPHLICHGDMTLSTRFTNVKTDIFCHVNKGVKMSVYWNIFTKCCEKLYDVKWVCRLTAFRENNLFSYDRVVLNDSKKLILKAA